MSLENYLVKSSVSYEEIRFEFDLHPEEVEQLYNRVKETGANQYFSFVVKHQEDILRYISLSPSQRKQKKWVNHPDILLIRLAALQISDATLTLQNDIAPIAEMVNRGSYRDFHAVIARGYLHALFGHPLSRFPFEKFENPFLS
jgi:hypothetical protein